jgi:hypothetical protein
MNNFAQFSPISKSEIKAPDYDATILLASAALMIVFAIAIYLASRSPGNAADAIALMAAFP